MPTNSKKIDAIAQELENIKLTEPKPSMSKSRFCGKNFAIYNIMDHMCVVSYTN